MGGDPALLIAGKNASVEQVENIRIQLGLNKPLWSQYFDFLRQTLMLDWGRSWSSQQNISDMLLGGLGPSLSLTIPAFAISVFLCVSLALFSTYRQGHFFDRILLFFCLAMMSISFLVYIIGYQYIFAYKLNLFPVSGWDPSWTGRWPYLFLPWLIAISVSLGPNILIYRSALLDEVKKDYTKTAKAKGLKNSIIYSKHILKNALIPISTVVMMQMPFLFMGSMLLEAFFGIPGIGGLLIQAIHSADFPVIKAMTLIGSFVYVLFNLINDLLYRWIDPRVQL